jgi:hypothetical protein
MPSPGTAAEQWATCPRSQTAEQARPTGAPAGRLMLGPGTSRLLPAEDAQAMVLVEVLVVLEVQGGERDAVVRQQAATHMSLTGRRRPRRIADRRRARRRRRSSPSRSPGRRGHPRARPGSRPRWPRNRPWSRRRSAGRSTAVCKPRPLRARPLAPGTESSWRSRLCTATSGLVGASCGCSRLLKSARAAWPHGHSRHSGISPCSGKTSLRVAMIARSTGSAGS